MRPPAVPLFPVVETLRREVERTQERYEAACRDLANWLREHPEDAAECPERHERARGKG